MSLGCLFSDESFVTMLVTRIAKEVVAVLRSSPEDTAFLTAPAQRIVTVGNLVVDLDRQEVTLNGNLVTLRPREFALLATLAQRPGYVHSRARLLDVAWPDPCNVDDRSVDVHVSRVRKHLGPTAPRIESVSGIGYKLVDHN